MATHSNYALRLPEPLMEDLRVAAEREGVSMDSFIAQALTEKVAVLRTRDLREGLSLAEQSTYLQARAARAQPGRMAEILAKAGAADLVFLGDEVPEDWLQKDDTVTDDRAGAPQPRSTS